MFLILPFRAVSLSLYFLRVRSSFRNKNLHLWFTSKYSKLSSSTLLVQYYTHKTEYIIVSFSIFSLIVFSKGFVDRFGSSTKNHSSVSRKIPPNIHSWGRFRTTLTFALQENIPPLRRSCQILLFSVVHV